ALCAADAQSSHGKPVDVASGADAEAADDDAAQRLARPEAQAPDPDAVELVGDSEPEDADAQTAQGGGAGHRHAQRQTGHVTPAVLGGQPESQVDAVDG